MPFVPSSPTASSSLLSSVDVSLGIFLRGGGADGPAPLKGAKTRTRKSNPSDDDDDDNKKGSKPGESPSSSQSSNQDGRRSSFIWRQIKATLPSISLWRPPAIAPAAALALMLKVTMVATVSLYILNQNHALPKPISQVVSKVLFWPTLPITVLRRKWVQIKQQFDNDKDDPQWWSFWMTDIDDTVTMGGAPFGFLGVPQYLYNQKNVRGVVNFCKEYKGPTRLYQQLGMKELYLPTVDHFEPSYSDLKSAIEFIRQHEKRGERVYVHCRAGHGRSAAGVFAWWLQRNPLVSDLQALNQRLCSLRNVRSTLWKQENIQKIRQYLVRRATEFNNKDTNDYPSDNNDNDEDDND